ncbi:hypothetical protein MSG28_005929 [Choristoneura fumiferana]|uniref:Uncharacterized protein n=1 Tax=Choristoneura fumiferana TaxID=7141 RepID=A0ACC0L1N3_CHOFU|nr:hypothetical protein MSG28_005929 [Choristoneura fumiferana]
MMDSWGVSHKLKINRYVEINRICELKFEGVVSEKESLYKRRNTSIMNANAKRNVGRSYQSETKGNPGNEKSVLIIKIKGVIIDLESDTNSDAQTEHSTITRTESKRRAKSSVIPRPIPSKRPSIYDLCTPENKLYHEDPKKGP